MSLNFFQFLSFDLRSGCYSDEALFSVTPPLLFLCKIAIKLP